MVQPSYYRTIWISDVHLGTRACKASALLDFLRSHIAETLYLVGDIVDDGTGDLRGSGVRRNRNWWMRLCDGVIVGPK
jgi:UDP-2,3-diacylglucosamine pyrophosphatase LpxH